MPKLTRSPSASLLDRFSTDHFTERKTRFGEVCSSLAKFTNEYSGMQFQVSHAKTHFPNLCSVCWVWVLLSEGYKEDVLQGEVPVPWVLRSV